MMLFKLSIAQRKSAVKLYLQGKSSIEVGNHFGVSSQTIINELLRQGVTPRRYTGTPYKNIQQWRTSNPNYQTGHNNPAWKGGTSKSTINRLVKRVLDNAGVNQMVCQQCHKKFNARLNIHHKDNNRQNNKLSNLEVLCSVCHNSGWSGARHPRKRSAKTGRFV
jgi:IS30 family transposase